MECFPLKVLTICSLKFNKGKKDSQAAPKRMDNGKNYGSYRYLILKNSFCEKHAMTSYQQNKIYSRGELLMSKNYPICLQHIESIKHAIWECESIRDVWGMCTRQLQKRSIGDQSFRDLMTSLMEDLREDALT